MEQFKITQGREEFNPSQATNYVREFDEAVAERERLNRPYEDSVIRRSQSEVAAADRKLKEMQGLAQLSETLMSQMTDLAEKKNEADYGRGLADALLDGPNEQGQQQLESQEAELRGGQKIATDAGNKYEAEGGNSYTAQEIRNTGGWYGYGKFVGQIQALGDNYGLALEEAKTNFSVQVGDKTLTYDRLESPDEYGAWTRAFQQQYLSGLPRTNGEIIEKYALKQIRQTDRLAAAEWRKEYNEERLAIAKEGRLEELANGARKGEPGLFQNWFDNFPGSKRDARLELKENLKTLVDAEVISAEDAKELYEEQTITKDGKQVSLADAYSTEYALFQDELDAAADTEVAEIQRARTRDAEELRQELKGQELSNAQILELQNSPRYRDNPAAKAVLDDHITIQERDDAYAREYLDDLTRSGNLSQAELDRFPPQVAQEYEGYLDQQETIEGDFDAEEADDYAEAAARQAVGLKAGEVSTNSFEYLRAKDKANGIYKDAYMRARRRGQDHDQATQYAIKQLEDVSKSDPKTGQFPLLIKQPVLKPDDQVQVARQWVKTNPGGINDAVIPDSEPQLKAAYEYLRTGRGSMPGFYAALASGQPYTAEELAIKQAELAGYDVSEMKKDPLRMEREKLPPNLQRLIKVYPNSRGFTQATLESTSTGDTKYFLDTVASKESASFGGYDAYNLGGKNGGHTAIGSGNSAEDGRFGKPISQLTVGEIKRLQANGELWAAGRYQFVTPTFKEVAAMLGVSDDTVFNSDTQDVFAIARLVQRASWGSLKKGLKAEWIGLQYLRSDEYQRLLQAAQGIVARNNG